MLTHPFHDANIMGYAHDVNIWVTGQFRDNLTDE